MIALAIRLLLLVCAGFALFRLWRATDSGDRFVNAVIALGFLGRAFVGEILFWIAYLRLPIARSLQIGEGLWFFALDALLYYPTSKHLAHSGLKAIVDYPIDQGSIAFVKTLATAMLFVGDAVSVALLLNLFCYLGSVAVIVHWTRREPRVRVAAAVAICAISVSPGIFLWSLQPLKEALFQFIVIAFLGACAAWQRAWAAPAVRWRNVLVIAAVMFVTLQVTSGVRWYFAFVMFMATGLFLLLIAATARARKAAFAASAVLFVLLSRAFLFGGGPYVPPEIAHRLSPWDNANHDPSRSLIKDVETTRANFEQAGGGTAIRVGGNLSHLDRALTKRASKAQEPIKRIAETQKQDDQKRLQPPPPALKPMASSSPSPAEAKTTTAVVQKTESAPAETPVPPTRVAEKVAPPTAPAAKESAAIVAPPAKTPPAAAAAVNTTAPPTPPPAKASPAPAPSVTTTAPVQTASAPPPSIPIAGTAPAPSAQKTTAIARTKTPDRKARTPSPTPAKPQKPVVAAAPAQKKSHVVTVAAPEEYRNLAPPPPSSERAKSIPARLLVGAAAVVVPRSVGDWLGVFKIGGGRGMLWFTELDTLVFDALLLWVLILIVRGFSTSWRNPLAWLVVLLTVVVAGMLAYTITNYGTLVRLRAMVYSALAIIPLALAAAPRREKIGTTEDAPAE